MLLLLSMLSYERTRDVSVHNRDHPKLLPILMEVFWAIDPVFFHHQNFTYENKYLTRQVPISGLVSFCHLHAKQLF